MFIISEHKLKVQKNSNICSEIYYFLKRLRYQNTLITITRSVLLYKNIDRNFLYKKAEANASAPVN